MEARNPLYTRETRKQLEALNRLGLYHSIELPDGRVLPGLQSIEQLRRRIEQFPIPQDLRGRRVLDIGAWDGWFSFEMEKRGADVVAIDSAEHTQFFMVRELLNSKVEHHTADICRVRPQDFGRFDIVLFFGVLYHVKHPLLALENVCDLSTDLAFVESYVSDDGLNPATPPLMEFYEIDELRGQFDNWVGPNLACLMAFCRTAGFARVDFESAIDLRAHVSCYRKWAGQPGVDPAPYITCVENSVSRDHRFSRFHDDYVSLWFKTDDQDLKCDEVFPEFGPYGSRPVHIHNTGGDGWHAVCKLPPGLDAGWHEVRMRLRASAMSNTVRIGIDVPDEERRFAAPVSKEVRIQLVTDGRTWDRFRIRAGADSCVSLWVAGLPDPCDKSDVRVLWNGTDLPAIYVSGHDREGLSQVNALLPSGMRAGRAEVSLAYAGLISEAVAVELV